MRFQRRNIVSGEVEPTDEECEWQSDHEDEAALAVRIICPLTLKSDRRAAL